MKHLFFSLFFLLTAISGLLAQSPSTLFFTAGVNVFTIEGKDAAGERINNSPVTGGKGGLIYNYQSCAHGFQTGTLLSQKGSNLKNYQYHGTTWFGELRTLYLEIPLHYAYRISKKWMAGGGAQVAIGIGGEAEVLDDKFRLYYATNVSSSSLSSKPIQYRPVELAAGAWTRYFMGSKWALVLEGQQGLTRIDAKLDGQRNGRIRHVQQGLGLRVEYRVR